MAQRLTLLRDRIPETLLSSIQDTKPVKGLTHFFYRYPARFSPQFARAVIDHFSGPGDLVVDPFVGSGTTIIESRVAGRRSVGIDISELACFITRVKATVYKSRELSEFERWAVDVTPESGSRTHLTTAVDLPRNLHTRETWRIRKDIEGILSSTHALGSLKLRNLARCTLLRTSQWALDCRSSIPSVREFRLRFQADVKKTCVGAQEFSLAAQVADRHSPDAMSLKPVILNRSAIGLEDDPSIRSAAAPNLVLTSPPYPGVHILYHRWQIQSRKETDAAFWISNTNDGSGGSFYTFGDRKLKNSDTYYEMLFSSFSSLARICGPKTWIVQLVSFSNPKTQLSRYLDTMAEVGFQEVLFSGTNSGDGRIWRAVPNRKWYTSSTIRPSERFEVSLFHRLA